MCIRDRTNPGGKQAVCGLWRRTDHGVCAKRVGCLGPVSYTHLDVYKRQTYARAAAIILYDFCQSLHIPVMVYGHSTDDGVALYSYAEFDSIDQLDLSLIHIYGNRYVIVEGICTEVTKSMLFQRAKAVTLEAGGKTLRVQLKPVSYTHLKTKYSTGFHRWNIRGCFLNIED